MRAVEMIGYGGPEQLRLVTRPDPEPGPGQVRIRVRAAAVNPADPKWRQGMFASFVPVPLPHVLGYDVAGTIDAVGDGVDTARLGTRVVTMLDAMTKGGYAELALAPADAAVAIPDALDAASAAAIPTAGLTGVQMAEDHTRAAPGLTILVTGAVGAVGRFATHAAVAAGARVVAAVRPAQADAARALGAAEVIAIDGDGWTGARFDVVLDTIGGAAVAALCRHLRPGGAIFTAATTPIDPDGLPAAPEFIMVHADPARLARLVADVAAGAIAVPIAHRLPLAEAAAAHRLVEAGGAGGKVILEP